MIPVIYDTHYSRNLLSESQIFCRDPDGVPHKLHPRYGAGDICEKSGERRHRHNAGAHGVHADTDVCQSHRNTGEDLAVHIHGHRYGNDDEDDGRRQKPDNRTGNSGNGGGGRAGCRAVHLALQEERLRAGIIINTNTYLILVKYNRHVSWIR